MLRKKRNKTCRSENAPRWGAALDSSSHELMGLWVEELRTHHREPGKINFSRGVQVPSSFSQSALGQAGSCLMTNGRGFPKCCLVKKVQRQNESSIEKQLKNSVRRTQAKPVNILAKGPHLWQFSKGELIFLPCSSGVSQALWRSLARGEKEAAIDKIRLVFCVVVAPHGLIGPPAFTSLSIQAT